MDVATHTLVGYALSRAGLNRLCPSASAILILAANAPDIDLISMAGGDLSTLEYHRGVTHSLLSLPAVALIPLLVIAIFSRGRIPWRRAWVLSGIGVASHLLLDWTTEYGARLLSPLRNQWFHLDILPGTDVVICGILLLLVGWLAVSRLVTSEIGANASSGRGAALAALLFVSVWIGARGLLHNRAVVMLDSRLYNSSPAVRVAAFPHFANPLQWRGLAETRDEYHVVELSVNSADFDPTRSRGLYKTGETEAISAAKRAAPVETFLEFARYPYWTVSPSVETEGALDVEVVDLGFAMPGEGRFLATATVTADHRIVSSRFRF